MSSKMKKNRSLIANYFWTYDEDSAFNAFKGLCNRLGYLLSEQGLICGENVRDLELPDFFCVNYDDEGPMLCTAMVILKGRGKTNQYGKPLFSGYFRHVDVKLCTVSAAAFFLFIGITLWMSLSLIFHPRRNGMTFLCSALIFVTIRRQ